MSRTATVLWLGVLASHAGATGADRAALETTIHDYLLNHPEILMEMNQALQLKQRNARDMTFKQMLPAARQALLYDSRDGVVGNPKGDVNVVIFQDKECPYCKALLPTIQQLIGDDPGIRVVYKEYPILGTGSAIAASATLAARAQDKFEAFHNALLADKTPEHQLDEKRILAIAQSVGLDMDRLRADMAAPAIAAKIADNKALALSLGIQGTPGVIVGDHLESFVPYERLKQLVEAARAAAGPDISRTD